MAICRRAWSTSGRWVECVGDQVLHGANFVGRGDGQGVGGDDAGTGHLGVFISAARDHVLEDGFLFLAQAAGIDQVLAGGKYLGVGARHFDLRERALFHLRADVGEQFLGEGDGLLLHLLVFGERHQVGVEADHAVDRQDQLLLEEQAGDLLFVAGDADEAAVQAGAVAAQQRLRGGESEGGTGIRVVAAAQRVPRDPVVVEVQTDLRAGREALLNLRR